MGLLVLARYVAYNARISTASDNTYPAITDLQKQREELGTGTIIQFNRKIQVPSHPVQRTHQNVHHHLHLPQLEVLQE